MLKRAFELKGYHVFEAEDGGQALEMARRYRPSLIVIDLNMPVLDGLETVQEAFASWKGDGDRIPIVAITAYDVYGMEEAALETGCNCLSQQTTRSRGTRSRPEGLSASSFELSHGTRRRLKRN